MSDTESQRQLRQLIDGYRTTALLYVAARLRIADLLAGEPCHSGRLAQQLSVNADALHRVLRGLAAIGILAEEPDGRFSLAKLGAGLRSQSPGSLAEWAILAGEEYSPAWGSLLHTVRTGETAFDHVFGLSPWNHRLQHPPLNEAFHTWLSGQTSAVAQSILQARDFSNARLVADVGGGQGALLSAILLAHPALNGILLDQPCVIASAGLLFEQAGIANRCHAHAADFFVAVTHTADLYLLKSVLHDWDDEHSLRILQTCRKAMSPSSRLLVIERILPHRAESDPATILLDLHMLSVLGGRERTVDEYLNLALNSGLAFTHSMPTSSGFQILEFQPQGAPGQAPPRSFSHGLYR